LFLERRNFIHTYHIWTIRY